MAVIATRRIGLRAMTTSDLRHVRRIERAAYGRSLPGTPFEREMQNGLAHYFVAVEREDVATQVREPLVLGVVRRLLGIAPPIERIVGFAGVWFTVDQLHVVTIAVEPAMQGRGIAQRMLFEVYRLAADAELKTLALEVRVSNERARRLYERFGFQRVGTLRGYYSDNNEDALVMLTPDLQSADFLSRVRLLREGHARAHGDAFEEPNEAAG